MTMHDPAAPYVQLPHFDSSQGEYHLCWGDGLHDHGKCTDGIDRNLTAGRSEKVVQVLCSVCLSVRSAGVETGDGCEVVLAEVKNYAAICISTQKYIIIHFSVQPRPRPPRIH